MMHLINVMDTAAMVEGAQSSGAHLKRKLLQLLAPAVQVAAG